RTLTLPDNLPETKQAIAESVTRGLDVLYRGFCAVWKVSIFFTATAIACFSSDSSSSPYLSYR
ncbi:hypothetical protein MZD09_23060, partial [Escherichia coli]|nr:hypothetical protein [Escherichia coli]